MIAAALAKQAGEQYIGLQGDVFDTQKDMALGLLGALLAMLVTTLASRNKQAPRFSRGNRGTA